MNRLWFLLLIGLVGTLPAAPSSAQQPAATATAPAAAPSAAAAGPTPQQAAQALAVLKDDARRGEMISVLETIARAAPPSAATASPGHAAAPPATATPAAATPAAGPAAPATAPAPAKLAIPLAPDSLGAEVLVGVSERLETLSGDISDTVRALTNFTLLERWAKTVVADPDSRAEAFDAGWKLLVVALIALALEAAAGRLIRPPRRALLRLAPHVEPHPDVHVDVPAGPPPPAAKPVPALAAVPLAAVPPPSIAPAMVPPGATLPGATLPGATLPGVTLSGAGIAGAGMAGAGMAGAGMAGAGMAGAGMAGTARAGTTLDTPHAEARRRRRARLAARLRVVPLMLARLLLDLLPLLVLIAAGYGLLGTRLGEPATTKLVILAVLNAYVAVRVVTVSARAILSPDAPGLRLVPMGDEAAWAALRWIRRLAVVALFGYAVAETGLLFGLYRVVHDAIIKMVALVVHLMLVVIVLQNRASVARLIHAPPGATGLVALVRNRVARVWHIVVVFYIVALWVVWALDVPGGFQKLLMVFASTVVVASCARVLAMLLVAWVEHAMAVDPGRAARTPGLDSALRRYQPILRSVIHLLIGAAAIILLLQLWGLDSLSWFGGDALGGRLVSATVTSAVTIALALLIWEAANAAVQNHLARLARDGHPARSARLRTLLPMLRTTLLVAITLFAGLTVLSQIGVNIAPLLAGAGVIGLAIGFGSQKLVQDIITGLFLLLENTMQVGDVVTLGGLTGTVENLSIRTIRLRALDGAVHIVPFSAVTTVTNLTRDFAYALLDVSVGLNEEPDRVADIVQSLAESMRAEARWGAAITDRMEVMGVEKFIDTAWVLRCRLRTVPSQRWNVARELNRRLKYRFDEARIESPFTSYRALSAAMPDPPNAKEAAE